MIVERWVRAEWLSNTWLVADRPGGEAVVIDPAAQPGPVLARIAELRVRPMWVLLTHHHPDHVLHARDIARAHGCPVLGHGAEAELFEAAGCPLDALLEEGDERRAGELVLRALHIPGHTRGQLAFWGEGAVFTGDTLFRGSVGGTRGRGHGTLEELRRSIERLLELPPTTTVYPGHGESSTLEHERDHNPFVRAWRGEAVPEPRACTAFGEPAELLLEARDYDGGTKCWVRFEDGREDVVPGSRVRAAS